MPLLTTGAGKCAAIGGGGASTVTLNATGSKMLVPSAATSANYTGLTIAAGTDRCLIVSVVWDNLLFAASGLAMTWNGVALTKIFSTHATGTANPHIEYWGLVNPATGNQTLALSWTASTTLFVVGMAFDGVDQTTPIANINAAHSVLTLPVISLTGRKVMATGGANAGVNFTGILGTTIYFDDGNASPTNDGSTLVSANSAAYVSRIDGTSPSVTSGSGGTARTLALIDIKATGDSSASATFDPSGKGAAITLLGGNLVALTGTGGSLGVSGVRGNTSRATGKYYAEFNATRSTGSTESDAVGICNVSFPVGTAGYYPGSDNNSVGLFDNGNAYRNGGGTSIGVTWVSFDTICMAVDMDNKKIWWAKGAAGNWNNSGSDNPATNTGGYSFAALAAGACYPLVEGKSAGAIWTANMGGTPYIRTAPSGFGNW